MNSERSPGFWSLCPAEPFRIFFPVGLLIAISGVSLWPLYFTGIHKFYPGIMHGRMMIQGFLTAFIFGFLGTAFPRLSGAAAFSRRELWTLLLMLAAVTGLQIGMQPLIADCVFLVLITVFAASLHQRFRVRSEPLPPSFVLVLLGLASAIIGTALLIAGARLSVSMALPYLGNSLLYQAYVLFPLLGVGGFLLPRFLGLCDLRTESEEPSSRAWRNNAQVAACTGGLILATYAAEAWSGNVRLWGVLRACIATAYLCASIPLYSARVPRITLAQSLRLGFVLLQVGLFLPAVWPTQRVAALHMVFIGGYSVITLSFATRVVLGHSGQGSRVQQRLPFLLGTVILLIIGGVLRVWGDFLPEARPAMLNMASYLWMLGAVVWGLRLLPAVRIPDSES